MSSEKILKKLKSLGPTTDFYPMTIEHENRVTATFRDKQVSDVMLSSIKREFPSNKYDYWIKIAEGNLCITIKKRDPNFSYRSGRDLHRRMYGDPVIISDNTWPFRR